MEETKHIEIAPHKDVHINGHKYRIERLKATVGSFMVWQVIGNMFGITEEVFQSVQARVLCACYRYEKDGLPMPVFKLPDTFAVPGLEYDLNTVAKLTRHAIEFNVAPFFEDPELQAILQQLTGSRPSPAQTSTNSSSGQS